MKLNFKIEWDLTEKKKEKKEKEKKEISSCGPHCSCLL